MAQDTWQICALKKVTSKKKFVLIKIKKIIANYYEFFVAYSIILLMNWTGNIIGEVGMKVGENWVK